MKNTILIVEDEEGQLEALANILSAAGFSVLQAKDGASGFASALAQRPDLILVDIKMPEMSGFQMTKKLRASGDWGRGVPVIYLTNIPITDDAVRMDIENTEPVYYLIKSDVEFDDLIEKIRKQLGE